MLSVKTRYYLLAYSHLLIPVQHGSIALSGQVLLQHQVLSEVKNRPIFSPVPDYSRLIRIYAAILDYKSRGECVLGP